MNFILVSIDNGLSYDDQQSQPVAICENMESALQYIDSHPITDKVFRDAFYYNDPNSLTHAHYYTQEVEFFKG